MKNEAADIYDTFSLELKLILLCSQVKIIDKELQAINQLLAGPIDWDLFLNLAKHHQVYPLVYQSLTTLANSVVPDKIMTVLRQKVRENTSKTLKMTGELVNVLRAMEENVICAVVLKGFPLGFMLYSNLALRPSGDLDILVRPEEVDKSIKVIENQGYERILKTTHHFVFWHREREIRLELHWRLGYYGIEIPLNEIENSLILVKIAGQAIYIPGAEELLLFLVLHGASHAWFRLKWLCDVGGILRRGGVCWERLYGLSECLGVEALLNQAIILVRQLLAVPVPDNIVTKITNDRKAQNLVSKSLPFIFAVNYDPTDFSKPLYFHRLKYEFSIQLGWRKKVAYLNYLYSKLSPME